MHANHREEVDQGFSGDIVALVGLKDISTGDTLADEKHPILLESVEFPNQSSTWQWNRSRKQIRTNWAMHCSA